MSNKEMPVAAQVAPDQIAESVWKCRMVLYDAAGDPVCSRQPSAGDLPNGCPEYCWCGVPTPGDAEAMGATGGQAGDNERLAFEAWMRSHCWALCAHWDGKQYVSDGEQGGWPDPQAMATRRLWAAWRDRAALARLKTPN